MKVGELLRAAGALLDEPVEDTATVWPLGAAVLIRQAIEGTLEFFWRTQALDMMDATYKQQWLALPAYIGRAPEAAAADYAWSALSEACHHRDYDVGLTEAELHAHLATARAFARVVAGRVPEAR